MQNVAASAAQVFNEEFERVYPDRYQTKYGYVATSLRSVPDVPLRFSQAVSRRSALASRHPQGRA